MRPFTASISRRPLTDRSFRLAYFGDLAVVQPFVGKARDGHIGSFKFARSKGIRGERDMEKQVVIDLSHEQGYKRGHIPNSVNLPLAKFDFCRVVDTPDGIQQDEVYAALKELGVGNDTSELILYDNSGLLSCRLWFVLRYFGFKKVRILNGGWREWLNAGLPVEEAVTVLPEAKSLDMNPKRAHIVKRPAELILDHARGTSQFIDTRDADAYQMYHIPRAVSVPSTTLMQDGWFTTVDHIRNRLQKDVKLDDQEHGIKAAPIVIYSNLGLTASVGYFCLSMAGIDKISLFDQGLANWVSNHDDWEMKEEDVDEDHWRR